MIADDVVEVLNWLYSVPRSRVPELEPRLEMLLDHEHPFVREEAIRILVTRWKLQRFEQKSIEMSMHDAAEEVRSAAVYALSAIADSDTLDDHTNLLRRLLMDPKERSTLKQSAYESLLIMHRRPAFPHGSEFDPERDVDWSWVNSL